MAETVPQLIGVATKHTMKTPMKYTQKKTGYSVIDCRDSYGNGPVQVVDASGKLVCDCFTDYDAELIALLLRKNSA